MAFTEMETVTAQQNQMNGKCHCSSFSDRISLADDIRIAGCHLGIIMCVIRCALIRLGRRYGQIDRSIGLYFWTNGADD